MRRVPGSGLAAAALLGLTWLAPGQAGGAGQITFDPAATVAFPTLAVPVGVRATGMGDAYTAVGDDVYALRWNPAGLALVKDYQLGVMDNEWSSALGLRQDFFALAAPLEGGGTLAGGLDYFNLGQLDQRDGDGTGATGGALLGRSNASALGLTLGYARPLMGQEDLQAGVAVEAVQQQLYGLSNWGYGVSPGILWEPGERWSLGLSLNHLGVSSAGGSPPMLAQIGLSSLWDHRRLILAADAELPRDGTARLKAGGEFAYGDIRFRAGWRQALGDADSAQLTGFTAGAGFKVGSLSLDYSYVPYGELSTVHRLQATLDLPRDFFEPRLAVAEGTTQSAQAYFDAAQGLEKSGDTLKALIQYQRCLESYPLALRSSAQPFYAAANKKIDELQAELTKGGDHSQIQKLTNASIAAADQDLRAGHYQEAIARLEQARQLDPTQPLISARLNAAQQILESHLRSFRDAAQFAAKEDNLPMAVESYRKILAMAPDDPESLAYLSSKRKAIKALLQGIDRKAIYFYVAGHLEEAIKAWTDGMALDSFGDVDFKRNIEKARKQLELRGRGD